MRFLSIPSTPSANDCHDARLFYTYNAEDALYHRGTCGTRIGTPIDISLVGSWQIEALGRH